MALAVRLCVGSGCLRLAHTGTLGQDNSVHLVVLCLPLAQERRPLGVPCYCQHWSQPPRCNCLAVWPSAWVSLPYHHLLVCLICTCVQSIPFFHPAMIRKFPSAPSWHVRSCSHKCSSWPWEFCGPGHGGVPSFYMHVMPLSAPLCTSLPVLHSTTASCTVMPWSLGPFLKLL